MAASAKLRVLGLTRYIRNGPSSRYRFYQFQSPLAREGIDLEICPLLEDWYIDYLSGGAGFRPARIVYSYLKRLGALLAAKPYDLIWVEKEILPWIPFAAEALLWRGKPIVVDLDDNHFQRYEDHPSAIVRGLLSTKMARIVTAASGVTCGNTYLADLVRAKGSARICHIPTVVDLDRYPADPPALQNPEFVIGWIGTSANIRYLDVLRRPLSILAEEGPVKIMTVGAPKDALAGLPVEILPWHESDEIANLSKIDVGIMPLPDEPFERGKCGLKLIQYMAAWKPTIASPVGANLSIVAEGKTGFLVNDEAEWLTALRRLRDDRALRLAMGRRGRQRVVDHYSIPTVQSALADFLRASARPKLAELVPEERRSSQAPAAT